MAPQTAETSQDAISAPWDTPGMPFQCCPENLSRSVSVGARASHTSFYATCLSLKTVSPREPQIIADLLGEDAIEMPVTEVICESR
jgi:hypothetical protein